MKTTTKTFLKPLLFITIGSNILTIAYASMPIEKTGSQIEPVAIDKKSGECRNNPTLQIIHFLL